MLGVRQGATVKQLKLAFQLQLPHVHDQQSAAALARLEAELQAELERAELDLVGQAFGRHGHHHAAASESTRGESPYPATPCPHAGLLSTAPHGPLEPAPSQAERGTRSPSKAKPRPPRAERRTRKATR